MKRTNGSGASTPAVILGWGAAILVAILNRTSMAQLPPPGPTTAPSAAIALAPQVQLGNVFAVGETPAVAMQTAGADRVAWVLRDFAGKAVASGTQAHPANPLVMKPTVPGKGFFMLTAEAFRGDDSLGSVTTSLAVVPPVDRSVLQSRKFGLMMLFSEGMSPDAVPLVARAGIGTIRDVISWNATEKEKGVLVIPEKFDVAMKALQDQGIAWLIDAGFGNKLYRPARDMNVPPWQAAPCDEEGYAGYANYCAKIVEHFGERAGMLEMWDDYQGGGMCAGPAADDRPRHYLAMTQAARKAVKKVRPETQIVAGDTVGIPLPYFEKLFKVGFLDAVDAVTILPQNLDVEEAGRRARELAALIRAYNGGKAKPILATEATGWDDKSPQRVEAAGYLVRMYATMFSVPGVEHVGWIMLHDWKSFQTNGLMHGADHPWGKYAPTTLYAAYANYIDLLGTATFVQAEDSDRRTRLLRFDRGDKVIWVAWSLAGETTLSLDTEKPVTVVRVDGSEQLIGPVNKRASVGVGELPIYIVVQKGSVAAMAEKPRVDRVLADSASDFSQQKNGGGWSYGEYVAEAQVPYDYQRMANVAWEPGINDMEYRWQGPDGLPALSSRAAFAGIRGGKPVCAVRRWTASIDGRVHIAASLQRGKKDPAGSAVRVFVNGKEIARAAPAPGDREQLGLTADVRQGSVIDFVLFPGSAAEADKNRLWFQATICAPSAAAR